MRKSLTIAALPLFGTLTVLLLGADPAAQPAMADHNSIASSDSMMHKPVLSLADAHRAVEAAIAKAQSLNAGGAIADDGGYVLCVMRIDNTFPAASDVSMQKARTAAIFRRPTQDFENAIRNGRTTLLGVNVMTPLEGGVPITIDGVVVGAIGVSGAHSSTEDVEIALAGATAVSR